VGRRLVASWVVLAALCASGPVADAHAAQGCTLQPTNGTTTRVHGVRTYELHVPAGLTGRRVPLLITMHGTTQWGRAHESETHWSQLADEHGFIVGYPNGLANAWNVTEGSYDVAFLRSVAADIRSKWCVDPARVHASGYSLGAHMAQRLACDAPNVFASVTGYAGGSPNAFGGSCRPSRGVSVGLFHGDADFVVPLSAGQQARDEWVARNRCAPTPTNETVSEGLLQRWSGCADGAEVLWRTYPGQSHAWPQGDRGDDIRSRMWAFLAAHPRPHAHPARWADGHAPQSARRGG
jgi:polyhydroxybutyrate depolymerase